MTRRLTARGAGPEMLDASWDALVAAVVQAEDETHGLRSGFSSLDATLGGLEGVIVIGGLYGVGKTFLALQLAWQVAALNDAVVLFQSAEMSVGKLLSRIGRRMLAEHGASVGDIDSLQGAFKRVARRIRIEGPANLAPVRSLGGNVDALRSACGAEHAFVVLDSAHAIARRRRPGRAESFKDVLDRLLQDLRVLSDGHGACVLVLARQPKSGDARRGGFAFSGTASFEYDADVVGLLTGAAQRAPGAAKQRATLRFTKIRDHAVRDVPLTFLPAECRFEERWR